MLERCPKCGHAPLPPDPSPLAECPSCGVILARAGRAPARDAPAHEATSDEDDSLLWHVPEHVDAFTFRARVILLVLLAIWGFRLCRMDYRDGEIGSSFLHGPLLVFHEAGHVIFRPFGEWLTIAGGTLGQLLMPAILGGALLWKNRDPFGASVGLWLFGVSVLDVAPYVYDALHPQLILLGGGTGDDGPHDWIFLLNSVHRLRNAQGIGAFTHAVASAWSLWPWPGAGRC